MRSNSQQQNSTVYVQYCRSCETHTWCTHHQEQKYHQTFLCLSDMIAQKHPELDVIGNMVPSHLVPFKIAENKYIDAKTNKYTVYPQIGAFEVRFREYTIFSKKQTNSWPNIPHLLRKIQAVLDPSKPRSVSPPQRTSKKKQKPVKKHQSPQKYAQSPRSPQKNHKNAIEMAETATEKGDSLSFVESQKPTQAYRKPHNKGFTLTDHFKQYRCKQPVGSHKDFLTQKSSSSIQSRQFFQVTRQSSSDRKSSNFSDKVGDLAGQSTLRDILRNKAGASGRKEMIINLASIQQQNGQQQMGMSHRAPEYINNPRAKSKIAQFQNEMNTLEHKFDNFSDKVKHVQARNLQFEMKHRQSQQKMPPRNILQKIQRLQKQQRQKSPSKKQSHIFADKTNKVDQYVYASQQQKNQKLHQIYGQWKLIKHYKMANYKQSSPNNRQSGAQEQNIPDSLSNYPLTFKPKQKNKIKNHEQHSSTTLDKNQIKITKQQQRQSKFKKDQILFKEKTENFQQYESQIHRNNSKMGALSSAGANIAKSLSRQQFSKQKINNIQKINARISGIQQKINDLNQNNPYPEQETKNNHENSPYKPKSMSRNSSKAQKFNNSPPNRTSSNFKNNGNNFSGFLKQAPKRSNFNHLSKHKDQHQTEDFDDQQFREQSKHKNTRNEAENERTRKLYDVPKGAQSNNKFVVKKSRKTTNKSTFQGQFSQNKTHIQSHEESALPRQQQHYRYEPHQPRKAKGPNRKFKNWREAHLEPTQHQIYPHNAHQQFEDQPENESRSPNKQVRNSKQKIIQSKNTPRKLKKQQKKSSHKNTEQSAIETAKTQTSNIRYGKIKKNNSRVLLAQNQTREPVQQESSFQQQKQAEIQDDEEPSEKQLQVDSQSQIQKPEKKIRKKVKHSSKQNLEDQQKYLTQQEKTCQKHQNSQKFQQNDCKNIKSYSKNNQKSTKTLGYFKSQSLFFNGQRKQSKTYKNVAQPEQNPVSCMQMAPVSQNQQIRPRKISKNKKEQVFTIDQTDLNQEVTKQYTSFLQHKLAQKMSKQNNLTQGQNMKLMTSPTVEHTFNKSQQIIDFQQYKAPQSVKKQQETDKIVTKESALQQSMIFPQKFVSKNSQKTAQNVKSKHYQVSDNVYCQSKSKNSNQVGVQKQLTFEVSIQTDGQRLRQITSPIASEFIPQDHEQSYNTTRRNNYLHANSLPYQTKQDNRVLRARIIDYIFSSSVAFQAQKFNKIIKGCHDQIQTQQGNVKKLSQIYPQGQLMRQNNLEVELVSSEFKRLVKVLWILSERGDWLISRLFEDSKQALGNSRFGVWLCNEYEWQCFLLDDTVKTDQQGNPLFTIHKGGQYWINVLQKALSKALGGYQQLQRAQTAKLFTLLTGCNAVPLKVKEDPSKNAKMLSMVGQCLRKNYIVHAQKNAGQHQTDRQNSLYYILSLRRGQQQPLLELSQDMQQSFWVKLSKFVHEFTKIEVMQLRVNQSFGHINLGRSAQQQLTVIQLDFNEQAQGCVTLSYIGGTGCLRAYLYRQQKAKLLKLVGQAKEKSKSNLFFEANFSQGRYFIFAQAEDHPARLSFLGQGHPSMRITQQVKMNGLKNEVAEYLPLKDKGQVQSGLNQTGMSWRRTPKMRDNYMESRLRQDFVEYVVGKSRRMQ